MHVMNTGPSDDPDYDMGHSFVSARVNQCLQCVVSLV